MELRLTEQHLTVEVGELTVETILENSFLNGDPTPKIRVPERGRASHDTVDNRELHVVSPDAASPPSMSAFLAVILSTIAPSKHTALLILASSNFR